MVNKDKLKKILIDKDYEILLSGSDFIIIISPNNIDEIYYYNSFIKRFPSQAWLLFKEGSMKKPPVLPTTYCHEYTFYMFMKSNYSNNEESIDLAWKYLTDFFANL